jgi:hypothetical protein
MQALAFAWRGANCGTLGPELQRSGSAFAEPTTALRRSPDAREMTKAGTGKKGEVKILGERDRIKIGETSAPRTNNSRTLIQHQ